MAGASAYSRTIDSEAFRGIADEVGATLFMFDIAHIAGLIAGGVHPSPVPHAEVVTFTTHKTLRGPRGGCILSRAEHGAAIDKAIFPGLQGGPLEHVIAAKAVAFQEAPEPDFKDYAAQIVGNAGGVGRRARWREGFRLVSGGTDNHLMLVDLRPFDDELTGKEAADGPRPGRDHPQPEHRSQRPPLALRHQWRAVRHPVGHDPGHERARDGHHRLAHRPGPAPPGRRGRARRRTRRGRHPLLQVPALLIAADADAADAADADA